MQIYKVQEEEEKKEKNRETRTMVINGIPQAVHATIRKLSARIMVRRLPTTIVVRKLLSTIMVRILSSTIVRKLRTTIVETTIFVSKLPATFTSNPAI